MLFGCSLKALLDALGPVPVLSPLALALRRCKTHVAPGSLGKSVRFGSRNPRIDKKWKKKPLTGYIERA
jgi:hypothetical protein